MPLSLNNKTKARTFRGLSMVEVIIVVSILAVLAAIGAGSLADFRKNSDLIGVAELGLSLVSEARARTLSSEDSSQFGVYFEEGAMILFRGSSYAAEPDTHATTTLPATVEISNIALVGGGQEVVFRRLTGETDEDGTIVFRLKSEPTKGRLLTILPSGSATVVSSNVGAGLAAYWPLDEGGGLAVYDESANGNDGMMINMEAVADRVAGKIGNALIFDGDDEFVSALDAGSLDITGELSVAMWVKPAVDSSAFHSSWNYFIFQRDDYKYEIGYYNTDGPRFKPINDTGTPFEVADDLLMSADTWYHVTAVRRGTAVELYVDGLLEDSRNDFTGDLRSGSEVRIGGAGSPQSGFIGTIDEVRIYDRALSSEETRQLYLLTQ